VSSCSPFIPPRHALCFSVDLIFGFLPSGHTFSLHIQSQFYCSPEVLLCYLYLNRKFLSLLPPTARPLFLCFVCVCVCLGQPELWVICVSSGSSPRPSLRWFGSFSPFLPPRHAIVSVVCVCVLPSVGYFLPWVTWLLTPSGACGSSPRPSPWWIGSVSPCLSPRHALPLFLGFTRSIFSSFRGRDWHVVSRLHHGRVTPFVFLLFPPFPIRDWANSSFLVCPPFPTTLTNTRNKKKCVYVNTLTNRQTLKKCVNVSSCIIANYTVQILWNIIFLIVGPLFLQASRLTRGLWAASWESFSSGCRSSPASPSTTSSSGL